MDAATWILVAAYLSLAWELCVQRVPSVASTYQLLRRAPSGSTTLAAARRLPAWVKVIRFGLPAALQVALYAAPLLAVFWPPLRRGLLPIDAMAGAPFQIVGVALVLAGRALTLTALARLRPSVDGTNVQTGGPYAWSRNPALLGLYAFLLGAILLVPTWLLFAGAVLHALSMHRRVLLEESHLLAIAGEPYRAYQARVPRYVGLSRRGGTGTTRVPR